jgi:zinc transporter, ZIP family
MPDQFTSSLPYILLATGAGILGSVISLFWNPNVTIRSAIQHFAAGAVLAAVAASVIPEVEQIGTLGGVVSGFVAGGLLMIALKWLVIRFEHQGKQKKSLPVGLAAAAAVDTLIDGILISAGFSANDQLGALLAIALSLELLFLTLSVGVEFGEGNFHWWQTLAVTGGIALLLLVGAMGAGFLLAGVSEATLAIVLSFGAAALIYLIAEELLVENVQAEESLFSTATLFSGFLALLILKLLEQS